MSAPKRKSNRITVGDQVFRWRFHYDEDAPWQKTVSIVADDDLNGPSLFARCHYDNDVTPAIVRRLLDVAFENGWPPISDEPQDFGLTDERIYDCFHGFPRLLDHRGNRFSWYPDTKGGLHLKIKNTGHPKGQLLATNCTLQREDCTEELAIAFIDAAIDLGWKHGRARRDCFWLEEHICSLVLDTLRSTG
ncbi:hypothetical protein Poly51_63830 [Rubripirellula tenax]|uniref:Uncharacterized protein n=1 Tax=Rubripirellula tenax TaxID=2528015 RepID=A0A5C6DYI2_9BACT|nr:hypothetical protein [Rubripirellula tenax]TWU41688.1 hypothetical protein Poly51_63830 [Rubripirellula tenax]